MKKQRLFIALLCMVISLSACSSAVSSGSASANPTKSVAASSPALEDSSSQDALQQKNEEEEIILGSVRDIVPGDGDAFYVSLSAYVWEPLTGDHNGVIEPRLAKSWEHNEDCTSWTFHLRDDVFFTDGTSFDADVCLANIERYKKGPLTSTYTTLDIQKSFPHLQTMEKVDEHTIKFTFSKPIATLEYALSDYGSPMISPSCFDPETGKITSTVIGSGRYKIKEHVQDQYATLERNDNYYGEQKGLVKTFRFKAIPDAETRYSALVSEEVLSMTDNGAILPKAAKELCETDARFKMDIKKSHMSHYLFVNQEPGHLEDLRLRQAISLAIDRDAINKSLYGGLLVPAYGILSYNTPFFHEIKGQHDPQKAKELAQEVLQGNRKKLRLIIRQFKAQNYPLKSVAEYLAQTLEEIGLDCTIEILDNAIYKQEVLAGNYDLDLTTTGLNNADPYSTLSGLLSSNKNSSNIKNHMGYYNGDVERLLEEAHATTDPQRRKDVYAEIQEITAKELPVIPLFYDVALNIHNTKLKGYTSDLFKGVSLPTIQWAK